jgi:hypothetical protein
MIHFHAHHLRLDPTSLLYTHSRFSDYPLNSSDTSILIALQNIRYGLQTPKSPFPFSRLC